MSPRRPRAALLLAAVFALVLMVPGIASASLGVNYVFNGHGDYSADGSNQGQIQAEVPAGSHVEKAFLYESQLGQGPGSDSDRTVTFDGKTVVTDFIPNSPVGGFLWASRADVTDQVSAKIGTGSGITNFSVSYGNFSVQGVGLVVVYSNPSSPQSTVAILDGGAATTGDTASLDFSTPIDTTQPGFRARMSLGIGFSYQGGQPHDCGSDSAQYSLVDVNAKRLTSCAGNYDDGFLITVGGVGDSPDNPANPYATAGSGAGGSDDELYDLAPFISNGDTSLKIDTRNPSADDNVFLSVISVSAQARVTTEICNNGKDDDGDGLVDAADPDCAPPPPPANSAPTVTTAAADATGTEGSTLSTSGKFTDPDGNPLSLSISDNPGTFVGNADGSWSWSMFATDNFLINNITVTADDGNGGTASDSFNATATNVPPTVTLDAGNPTNVDEGSTARTFKYSIGDPGTNDTVASVATSCGDGTKVAGSDTNTNHDGSFQCVFADGPDSTSVTAQATDDDGGVSKTASQNVTVNNVAPSATVSGPASVNEGDTATYSYTTSDPGDDSVSVAVSCGDNGTKVDTGKATPGEFTCAFADGPAGSDVSVTPTDSDGAQGDAAVQHVDIANVAPTAKLSAGNDLNVSEGSAHNYSYTISDPGEDTVQSVTTSCGDNGTKVTESNTDTGGTFQCSFADGPADSTVSVSATDSDGATGAAGTQSVHVNNVAPTVAFADTKAHSYDESKTGHTFSYTISDPGQDTVQSVATSCGEGGSKSGESNTDTSGSFTCVWAHGPAHPTVSVQATDSDGAAGNTATQGVTITDPPITASGSAVSGVEAKAFAGQKVASFTDPTGYATAAEYTASIDWGDGSTSDGTITKTGDGAFDVAGSHTYAEEGSDTVTVTVTDADNAANTATATSTAAVADAPVHAAGAAPITTGQAFSGAVGSFTDEANGPKSDFSATISWGDGASSAGTISGPDANGKFTVSGSHTYTGTGPYTATVTVTDVGGSSDSAKTSLLVYAFATAGGGAFTISDKQATAGNTVTYWGAQWEKANPFLSGSTGSASFKGYIPAGTAAPSCGTTWTSGPGNSPVPPATVPAYMAVVVASKESKSGSSIGGDVKKIVVVKTASGYSNDPGHAGTGTIVGSVCG